MSAWPAHTGCTCCPDCEKEIIRTKAQVARLRAEVVGLENAYASEMRRTESANAANGRLNAELLAALRK